MGNKNTNLLDQSGDIKLDASIEYRSKLFWKFQGAIFVDAGNIWTIRDYDNQPGGVFKFDKFYKQIAVAYGLGLRLDLDFFILRFDGGIDVYKRQKIDLHRPYVDDVILVSEDGQPMKRESDLIDVWFDSGEMCIRDRLHSMAAKVKNLKTAS